MTPAEEETVMGLAYERTGSGPPLMLLHGVGHRRQAWGAVVSLLAPYRELILVDLPGHGESPPLVAAGRRLLCCLRPYSAFWMSSGSSVRIWLATRSAAGWRWKLAR